MVIKITDKFVQKIFLLFFTCFFLFACVPVNMMDSDIMGKAKLDYKPDLENRLGDSGGRYWVPINPDKVDFNGFYSYKLKNIKNIKIEDKKFNSSKFLIQNAYTDRNKSKIDAIIVYAIANEKSIDINSLTVRGLNNLSRTKQISQLVWFKNSSNHKGFWSVRIPYNSIKRIIDKKLLNKKRSRTSGLGLFGRSSKQKNTIKNSPFSYKELNKLSLLLTKTKINKEYFNCCIKNSKLSANIANKSSSTITPNGSLHMNIDEVPNFSHLIILPAVINEIHEVKGEKLQNGYKVTRHGKVIGVSKEIQLQIAKALAANFKSVAIPSKKFTKWYVSQMKIAQSRVGRVSSSEALMDIGHMMNLTKEDTLHKNSHPAKIIRQKTDLTKLPKNSAYVSIEITRLQSDFNYVGITGEDDEHVVVNIVIYDVRRIPPKIQANKGSILSVMQQNDAPSLQYFKRYRNTGTSTLSFLNRNINTIKNSLQTMIKWKAKDLDIEFKKVSINISKYDDLGFKTIVK